MLQQHGRTHPATDSASMPALTSVSLLSSTVSGLIQTAGEVVDALHSAKSSSNKKTNSANQTQDANQLANAFAAYLAAAAHMPTAQAAPSSPSSNVSQKGALNSIKNASASLLPLGVVLALGPTTAISASMALRSTMAGGFPSSKTAQTPALAQGATSTVPTAANALRPAARLTSTTVPTAANELHPMAKQTSTPVTKTPSPSKGTQSLPTASLSDRNVPTPAKGTQNGLSGGRQTSESSLRGVTQPGPEAPPATQRETTSEAPVLALHDVPAPVTQDDLRTVEVSRTSVNDTRTSSPTETHSQQPAAVAQTPVEASSASNVMPTVAVGRASQPVQPAWEGRPTEFAVAATENSVHRTNTPETTSQPQSAASQSTSNSIVPIAAFVGQVAVNTTAAASNSPQASVPVAEQLGRALVTQANVVNHVGRTDFHLRLQPPQLGTVQIHLTATHDKVSARVVVAHEDTRQLIVGQVHQLRQSLADSGLVLGSFDVTRDGGGSSQGGYQQPPELPQPPATNSASPTVSTVAKTPQSVPTDGIDILA